MRLYLINPSNPLVSIVKRNESPWNRYRVWQPLGLMVLAGVTPPDWELTILDENLGVPDYSAMPRPDFVGITAFTSQAPRAYEIAAFFRHQGVPVVMGGIHASMCLDEAMTQVDSVVTGEGEGIWPEVLEDVRRGNLKPHYQGGTADMAGLPFARHDLLPSDYAMGAIQTTRGCPLNCSFCSVTSFNGARYRQRPISEVVREFQRIREKRVLVVDDNLIGTNQDHLARAKELFRALIKANLQKEWVCQAGINFADDDDLLALAAKAGCRGVFIGFESTAPGEHLEVGAKFNLLKKRDYQSAVRRIQRHNILVAGSFIIGFDTDGPGIGKHVADLASQYGVDGLNVLFLTPLPGTRLWEQMKADDRILLDRFPGDWKYYTLTYPAIRYKNLSTEEIIKEMQDCSREFYSTKRILSRVFSSIWQRRQPLISLAGNMSYRGNIPLDDRAYTAFLDQLRKKAHIQKENILPVKITYPRNVLVK